MNHAQVNLTLEIEADADPIAGRVHAEGEPALDFTGWVELTAAIERALAAARL